MAEIGAEGPKPEQSVKGLIGKIEIEDAPHNFNHPKGVMFTAESGMGTENVIRFTKDGIDILKLEETFKNLQSGQQVKIDSEHQLGNGSVEVLRLGEKYFCDWKKTGESDTSQSDTVRNAFDQDQVKRILIQIEQVKKAKTPDSKLLY